MNITKDVVDLKLSDFQTSEIWVWNGNIDSACERVVPFLSESGTWNYDDHDIFFTNGRLLLNDGSHLDALVTVHSHDFYICLVTVFHDLDYCDIPLEESLRDEYELQNFTAFLNKTEEEIFPMMIRVHTHCLNLTIEQKERYPYLE